MAVLATVLLVSLGTLALNATVRFDETRARDLQSLTDHAAAAVLARDVEDLELQLQQSLKSNEPLVGSFEIFPSKHGLSAKHSAAPTSPLEIDSPTNQPFAASLDLDKRVGFMVLSSNGGMISQLARTGPENQLAFFVAHLVKSAQPRDYYIRATISGTELVGGQVRPLDIFRHKGLYRVQLRPIAKTNLLTASVMPLEPIRARALGFARNGLGLIAVTLLLGFATAQFFESRRRRTLAWVRESMAGFRFGRMTPVKPPRWTSPLDHNLVAELQAQFSAQSPFSPFYAGRWLSPALRVATWLYFRETVSLWSVGGRENREHHLGGDWFVARIGLSKASLVESAMRVFGRAFSLNSYMFCQYSETEVLLVARTANFEEWFDRTKIAIKGLVDFGGLTANDIVYSGVHVPAGTSVTPDEILARLRLDEDFNPAHRRLTDNIASFHAVTDKEPVVKFSWVQVLAVDSAAASDLYTVDRATSGFQQVLARAKPVRLPPPPIAKERIGTRPKANPAQFRPRAPKISV